MLLLIVLAMLLLIKDIAVNVKAGNYIEDRPITCKEYVNIIGDGPKNTIINFDNANSTLASGGGINNSNMELRGLTIKNVTTGSNNTKSFVLYGSSNLTGVVLRNLEIVSSGLINYSIWYLYEWCRISI